MSVSLLKLEFLSDAPLLDVNQYYTGVLLSDVLEPDCANAGSSQSNDQSGSLERCEFQDVCYQTTYPPSSAHN